MANIVIRDFTEADRARYLALSEEFYTSDAVLHPIPRANLVRTFDMCVAGNPYLRGLALEADGSFAGYALLSLTWSNEAGGLTVLLEEAYIGDDHRGQGLGSAFLEYVEEFYKGRARRLRLEVTHTNQRAVRLYERMGYKHFNYLQMVKDL